MASKYYRSGLAPLTLLSRTNARYVRELPVQYNFHVPNAFYNSRLPETRRLPKWYKPMTKFPPLPVPLEKNFITWTHGDLRKQLLPRLQKAHPELFARNLPKGIAAEGFLERLTQVYLELEERNPERLQGLGQGARFNKLYREAYTLVLAESSWSALIEQAKKDSRFSDENALFDMYTSLIAKGERVRADKLIKMDAKLQDTYHADAQLWRDTVKQFKAMTLAYKEKIREEAAQIKASESSKAVQGGAAESSATTPAAKPSSPS